MTVRYLSHVELPQNADPPSATPKRTRRAHPKVRTGCITCKIRRKKCDETKPNCQRCTSTGRKCDGYTSANHNHVVVGEELRLSGTDASRARAPEEDARARASLHGFGSSPASTTAYSRDDCSIVPTNIHQNQRQQADLELNAPIFRLISAPGSVSTVSTITDLERHCFSYFRHRTGPQLASYFASTIWQQYSTNIALYHPVVFACAAAVGAVHRRCNLGISVEALQWCAYSDQLVNKAKRLLSAFERDVRARSSLQSCSSLTYSHDLNLSSSGHGIDDNDILMIAYMLLFNYDSFQTDFSAAVSSLKVGIKYLFSRPMRLVLHREESYPSLQQEPGAFVKFFEKIKRHATELFGSKEEILIPAGAHLCEELPLVPAKFNNLSQARDYIFAEVRHILHTPDHIWKSKASRITARNFHMNRILRWSAAYAETVRHMDRTEAEKRAGNLLRVARSLAYVLLYFVLRSASRISEHPLESQKGWRRTDPTTEGSETDTCKSKHRSQSQVESEEEAFENETSQSNISAFTTSSIWNTCCQQEDLMLNLHRLQIWADMHLDPTNPFRHVEHSVSFDSGVGPKLNEIVPSPQTSSKTRFIVKYNIMDKRSESKVEDFEGGGIYVPGRDLGIYGLAEQSSAIEEHAVLEVVKSRFAQGTNLDWVDVTLFAEERRILLQYCYGCSTGLAGRSRWVQEWWAF